MNGVMALIQKQWKLWISMMLMVIMLSGCSVLSTSSSEVSDLINTEKTNEENDQHNDFVNNEEGFDLLKIELTRFFRQFFSVSEEKILALNAYPVKLNEGYWNDYEAFQSNALSLLRGFMASELEGKMNKQFLTTNIHFPRFVEINGNVIIKYLDVEDLHYEIIKEENSGEMLKYTLLTDVIVKAEVISKNKFNQLYEYNNEKNYYIKINDETILENAEKDEIKVKCAYIVELENEEEKINLMSLKEKGEVLIPEENRRKIINNDFLKRVSYMEEPELSDEGLIKFFFSQFMNQDRDWYQYYQYAYDSSYDAFNQMMSDLDLKDYVMLEKEKYKDQFPKTIIPAKDDITSISMNKEDLKISVHLDTSKKSRKYIVEFPAKVRLSDYTDSDIIYKYLVIIEDDKEQGAKIKRIQYLYMNDNTSLEKTDINEEETEMNENQETI